MALPPSGSQVDVNAIRNEVNSLGGSVINRVQRGVMGPGSATITSIDINKSFVVKNGCTFSSPTGPTVRISNGNVRITGPTSLGTDHGPSPSIYIHYEVIEFA